MNPRPHFQALQYHLCSILLLATLLFLLFLLQKSISIIITTLVSPSLRRTSARIQFTIVFGVLGTQATFYYLVAGLFERDHLHSMPLMSTTQLYSCRHVLGLQAQNFLGL